MSPEVFSFKIPKKIKKEREEVSIDWNKGIRLFIEKKLREYHKREILKRARKSRRKMKAINSAELIRVDRKR